MYERSPSIWLVQRGWVESINVRDSKFEVVSTQWSSSLLASSCHHLDHPNTCEYHWRTMPEEWFWIPTPQNHRGGMLQNIALKLAMFPGPKKSGTSSPVSWCRWCCLSTMASVEPSSDHQSKEKVRGSSCRMDDMDDLGPGLAEAGPWSWYVVENELNKKQIMGSSYAHVNSE